MRSNHIFQHHFLGWMYKLLLLTLEINIGNNQQIVAFQIENFWELDVEQF